MHYELIFTSLLGKHFIDLTEYLTMNASRYLKSELKQLDYHSIFHPIINQEVQTLYWSKED